MGRLRGAETLRAGEYGLDVGRGPSGSVPQPDYGSPGRTGNAVRGF